MKFYRTIGLIALTLTLAACASTPDVAVIRAPSPENPNVTASKPTPPAAPSTTGSCIADAGKVGRPYTVRGVRYVPSHDPDYNKTGLASYYGKNHHGNQTASGETFNMNAMSAAHTTLPLPSCVLVTNLENGKSVILRVNDRGPFIKGRIIDVSYAAAKELDFIGAGLARVRVEVVD